MASKEQQGKKKINPVLWFLFAIIIPLIIVLVILAVIMSLAGVNVMDWTKEKASSIPVVSNLVSSPEETDMLQETEQLQAELQARNETIDELEVYAADLEATIAELEQELSRQEEITQRYESGEEPVGEAEEDVPDESLRSMALTFEEMRPANAAQILGNMEETEIIQILQELPNDARGSILQEMDPELAGNLSAQLME
jgi:flagellar motility protein MotE (MotC chaperone)